MRSSAQTTSYRHLSRGSRWCNSSTTSSSISSSYSSNHSTYNRLRASASTMPHRSRVRLSWRRLLNPSLLITSSRFTTRSNSSSSRPSNRQILLHKKFSRLQLTLLSQFSQDLRRMHSPNSSFKSNPSLLSPSFLVSNNNSLSSSTRRLLSPSRTHLLYSTRRLRLNNHSSNSKFHRSM